MSAVGILALLSVGAFFFAGEQSEGGCGMLLVGWLAGLPFVLVWIWLFSNVATGGGTGVFLVSYALLIGAAIRFGGEGSLL